jgi:polyphosphate kinase
MDKLPTIPHLLSSVHPPLIHRDLSWLQFNERVLAEARHDSNPLLKRLKFLSISISNLDEFFMIRFASLVRSIHGAKTEDHKRDLVRIETGILETVKKFVNKQERFFKRIQKELVERKVFLHLRSKKNSAEFAMSRKIFEEQVVSHLNLKKQKLQNADLQNLSNLQMLAFFNVDLWVEIPKSLPNAYPIILDTNEVHVFFLDDLILTHLGSTLNTPKKPGIIRLTRDSDLTVDLSEEDIESIPDAIRKNLGARDKGKPMRLQYIGNITEKFLISCAQSLKLLRSQMFEYNTTLCGHALMSLTNNLPEKISEQAGFNNPPLISMLPLPFAEKERHKLFDALKQLDFILHHPYDSFDAYINWIRTACEDPKVTMIEQTIYRTDFLSPAFEALKQAAKTKKVKIIFELRARFDELNNLRLAEELRNAGIQVAFGFGQLKLHAKITLVTRKEEQGEVLYTHLSTGNYSARTARLYTDIAILTSHHDIGLDARHFFDSIWQEKVPSSFKQLVTAPTRLQGKIRSLIKEETLAAQSGRPARVIAKVNSLVDPKVIEDLYQASCAGVKVDLIVRGACSLVPGIKGISENIRVISIVDRFLEHSRIYYFENAKTIYLSSADWMPRNFLSRLEIAFPVLDSRIYRYISEVILPGYLNDSVKAKELTAQGTWVKARPLERDKKNIRAQFYFEDLAKQKYHNTPLYQHPFFLKKKT